MDGMVGGDPFMGFSLIKFNNRLIVEELGYLIMTEISSYKIRYIDYIDDWRFDFGKRIVEFCVYLKYSGILGYKSTHKYPSLSLSGHIFIFHITASLVINDWILEQLSKVRLVTYWHNPRIFHLFGCI